MNTSEYRWMDKKQHLLNATTGRPVCGRKAKWTTDLSKVTCQRCYKLANGSARSTADRISRDA